MVVVGWYRSARRLLIWSMMAVWMSPSVLLALLSELFIAAMACVPCTLTMLPMVVTAPDSVSSTCGAGAGAGAGRGGG